MAINERFNGIGWVVRQRALYVAILVWLLLRGLAQAFARKELWAAPSLSLRPLQGQGGEFDFEHSSASRRSKSPPCRKRRDKGRAPSKLEWLKGWASPRKTQRWGILS
jgi:hypothetical protein